jgi:ketosteroid isomerase-like protein
MPTNEEVIRLFYTAFQKLDHQAMNECYDDDIVFSDPVFGLLRGEEAKCMWEMLCKNAKDFSLTYSEIEAIDDEYSTCKWVATYTFSKTGNKVVNRIKAFMKLKDGKIIEHSDAFRLSTWIGQALGVPGKLFGWMGWMKRKVQKSARKNLINFIEKKYAGSGHV